MVAGGVGPSYQNRSRRELCRFEADGAVAAVGFEPGDEDQVAGEHEDGEEGHLAEGAELAGGGCGFEL